MMQFVAHPLAIVTTAVRQKGEELDQKRIIGLLVSSFNTVSVDARNGPIVSFNLKIPSSSFDAIKVAGNFQVSFPWATNICDRFRDPKERDALNAAQIEKLIKEETVFTFKCKWLEKQSVQVADHMIMLGQVRGYSYGDIVDEDRVTWSVRPLAYRWGKYTKLGTAIENQHTKAGVKETARETARRLIAEAVDEHRNERSKEEASGHWKRIDLK